MNDPLFEIEPLRPATAGIVLSAAEVAEIAGSIVNAGRFPGLIGATTLASPKGGHMVFLDRCDGDVAARIAAAEYRDMLFLLPADCPIAIAPPAIFTAFPRETFSHLAMKLFDYEGSYWAAFEDSPTAQKRMPEVRIFPGCQIHASATLGAGSTIFPGCVIGPNVRIGERALLWPNCTIGFAGFGIYRGSDRRNAHMPHVGGVIIGDDVEFGSFTTVCSGTIHPTMVHADVKTDAHVHIAHNCQIGPGTRITAHAELSGSVTIGRDAWAGAEYIDHRKHADRRQRRCRHRLYGRTRRPGGYGSRGKPGQTAPHAVPIRPILTVLTWSFSRHWPRSPPAPPLRLRSPRHRPS
jgi:acetyltransferase-like isoleucine patch superfamily enzyme